MEFIYEFHLFIITQSLFKKGYCRISKSDLQTDAEKKVQQELKLFRDTHDTSNLKNLSQEEIDKFSKLIDATNMQKRSNVLDFMEDANTTFDYLLSHKKYDEFDEYMKSFNNYYQDK